MNRAANRKGAYAIHAYAIGHAIGRALCLCIAIAYGHAMSHEICGTGSWSGRKNGYYIKEQNRGPSKCYDLETATAIWINSASACAWTLAHACGEHETRHCLDALVETILTSTDMSCYTYVSVHLFMHISMGRPNSNARTLLIVTGLLDRATYAAVSTALHVVQQQSW